MPLDFSEASQIEVLLDDKDLVLHPRDTLRGGFRLNSAMPVAIKRAEVSVGWFTEGRGDTDEGCVFRQIVGEGETIDAGRAFPFECVLPDAPWSYEGKLIKIHWAVRVLIFPQSGKEMGVEERFRLLPKRNKGTSA